MHKLIEYFLDKPVIREWDEQGLLQSAGFKWSEQQMWVLQIFGTAAFVAVPYALLCLHDPKVPDEFKFMVMLGAAACVGALFLFGSIQRGISFERDGRVRHRGGWVSWIDMLFCHLEHADIASIEVTKAQEDFAVAIYTTGGGTLILSSGLSEPQARLVAVQLTIALRELRTSLSTIQTAMQPQAANHQPVWID